MTTVDEMQAVAHPVGVSFEAFFADNRRDVTALVLALRGDRVGAEDVVQEAFVRAYRRWDHVGRMQRPDAWVRRVALNLATSRWRRMATEARVTARLSRRDPADGTSVFGDVDDADAFWRVVRSLPPRQAQVVALHYAGDCSVADMAATLDIAEGTVKAALHAARRRLARRLGATASDAADDPVTHDMIRTDEEDAR